MEKEIEKLKQFLHGYEIEPKPQEIQNISGDFQLAGLKPLLGEKIRDKKIKRIVDMGCGNAILLKCLYDIGVIKEGVKYLGVDTQNNIKNAYSTIIELNAYEDANVRPLHLVTFDELLKNEGQLIIYRNVFHELKIDETAKIIFQLNTNLKENDLLIIQDMTNLPVAENSNVGWRKDNIVNVFKKCGFSVNAYEDKSRGGITVFLLIIQCKNENKNITLNDIKSWIEDERKKQLLLLLELKEKCADTLAKVSIARINHDIFALSQQLDEKVKIQEKVSSELVRLALLVVKQQDYISKTRDGYKYIDNTWFQNRGTPLQMIDQFLVSKEQKILTIIGPKLIGKKTLIWRSLAKIKHNRLPLTLNIVENIGILHLFEQLILGLKANEFLDLEIISKEKIEDKSIKALLEDSELMKDIVENTIIIIFDIEKVCNYENKIESESLKSFLELWCRYKGAKIFIESNFSINELGSLSNDEIKVISLRKFKSTDANYGEHQYPVHMLQELVPIEYRIDQGEIGGFPKELLETIDNHPYFAYIIAKMIVNNPDIDCLSDIRFLQMLKSNVLDEIMNNFALSFNEKELINILLIDGKRFWTQFLFGIENYTKEVKNLINKGLLYQINENEYQLTNVISESENVQQYFDFSDEKEKNIQNMLLELYGDLYLKYNNPAFYRKKIWYSLVLGEESIITEYALEEASNIAEVMFKDKKYDLTINYLNQIENHKKLTSKQLMRKASALIRTGHMSNGKILYETLINENKTWYQLRSSYADALLYIGGEDNAKKALDVLNDIPSEKRAAYWHYQCAKLNKVLFNTEEVFNQYNEYIKLENDIQKAVFRILEAISFGEEVYRINEVDNYMKILIITPYCNYLEAQIEIGSYYVKQGNWKEATAFLESAYARNSQNPYCVLSLIRLYCGKGLFGEAKKIIDRIDTDSTDPILKYARVYFYQCSNDFKKGEKLLVSMVNRSDINVHMMTQWMEFYYCFYQYKNEDNKSLLKKALRFSKQIKESNNIPALILLLNINKELKEDQEYLIITNIIKKVNSDIELNN